MAIPPIFIFNLNFSSLQTNFYDAFRCAISALHWRTIDNRAGPCTRSWVAILLICFHLLPFSIFTQAASVHPTIGRRDALADSDLTSASWIWTKEQTKGNTAFLKTYTNPSGKGALSATIWMTAVNQFTFWVNGQPIFQSGPGADDWRSVQQFTIGLNVSTNTFSVLAVNNANEGAPPPGLVAAIHIVYVDSSLEVLHTDASWGVVSTAIPPDFPTPASASASQFAAAKVVGPFRSGDLTVPFADAHESILSDNKWIWNTPVVNTATPAGSVAFRRTILEQAGKHAQTATVLMTADNRFSLYLNGQYVGAPPPAPVLPDVTRPQQFTLDISSSSPNTLIVVVENIVRPGDVSAGQAGLVASITVEYSDGSTSAIGTDETWLTSTNTSLAASLAAIIEQPDSALSPAFVIGGMGIAPWGSMTGVSNALAASAVPTSPYAAGTLLPGAPPSSSADHSAPIGLIVGLVVGGILQHIL
ncbi:hypothetical protein C8R46DRAFT_385241 [Mycena filopes]|nr:hypothetical protein C8R46DRAFT_385241 [Mycena filopes]